VECCCGHGNEALDSMNVGKLLRSFTSVGFSRRTQLHEVNLGCLHPVACVRSSDGFFNL
jgi:hypothetical protein